RCSMSEGQCDSSTTSLRNHELFRPLRLAKRSQPPVGKQTFKWQCWSPAKEPTLVPPPHEPETAWCLRSQPLSVSPSQFEKPAWHAVIRQLPPEHEVSAFGRVQ